jgi:hypothetical protein
VSLCVIDLPSSRKSLSRVRCPNCGYRMSVHQPDPQSPERLLGTCPACKSWYLMDCVDNVMFLIPDDHLRDGPVMLN